MRRSPTGPTPPTRWKTFSTPSSATPPPPKADASPEDKQRAAQVKSFLEQLRDGHAAGDAFDRDSDVGFYVLGLSPNASRLSVRLWEQSTVGQMEARLAQHLQDMHLVGQRDGEAPLFIRRIVEATGRAKVSDGRFQGYDADVVSPLLAGAIARGRAVRRTVPRHAADGPCSAGCDQIAFFGYMPVFASIKAFLRRNKAVGGSRVTQSQNTRRPLIFVRRLLWHFWITFKGRRLET